MPPPGIIGRLARVAFGLALLAWFSLLVAEGWRLVDPSKPPPPLLFWLFVLYAWFATPHLLTIGLGLRWRRWPQAGLLASAIVLILVDLWFSGQWWGPPLGGLLWAWLLWFTAYLGVSCVLAGALRTPGCEMRAIPHLLAVVRRRPTREYFCPGGFHRIDRWERRLMGR